MPNTKPLPAISWEELRKGGTLAPRKDYIKKMLEGDDDAVLSRQEVLDRVLGYFYSCIKDYRDENTGEIASLWVKNPTKKELAGVLGITSQALIDYVHGYRSNGQPYSRDNPDHKRRIATEDFDILRKAYELIESYYEGQLANNKNNTGSIFWLLNSLNSNWTNEHTTIIKTEEKPKMSINQIRQQIGLDTIEEDNNDNDE